MAEFGTRRSWQRRDYFKKVPDPFLPEIEFLVILAYQKFEIHWSAVHSKRGKIVAGVFVSYSWPFSCNYTYFLAKKVRRPTILEIFACHTGPKNYGSGSERLSD